jgi:hypothetical protein
VSTPKHVWAQWVPLQGPLARKPTAVSWRRRPDTGGDIYDMALLTRYGMEIVHTVTPDQNMTLFDMADNGVTHWLEGHPEPEEGSR